MGSGDHAPFDDLDHQWTFCTIADSKAPPGRGGKRLAPGLHAVPGPRGPASLSTILWERHLQITDRRVRGDGQEIAARPRPPADGETRQGVPSRRLQQS